MKNKTVLFNSYLSLAGYSSARILHMIQGDKTELEFELKDKNGETVSLSETQGQVQIVDSDSEKLAAVANAEISNGKATFVIDTVLPVDDYELYIKIGEYYFPSSSQSFVLKVEKAYDAIDVEESNLTTIDVVVNALREDVISAIESEIETQVYDYIENNAAQFKGEKGDPFTFQDFTDEQLNEITPEAPMPIRPDEMDAEELELIRGHSAYQIAVNEEGFEGTIEDWIASLKGEKGDKGDIGDSAYEEAVKNGFTGSESEWLESLKGEKGDKGDSFEHEDFTPEQLDELRGVDGEDGHTVDIVPITDEEENEIGYEIIVTTPNGETVSSGVIYHGKDLNASELTEEQLQVMSIKITKEDKDELGNTLLTFSDGTTITVSKGDRGEAGVNGLHGNTTSVENNEDGSYDIVVTNPNSETEISRTTVRDGVDGTNGTDGIDGESLKYEDLTPEQIAELQEGLPVRPPKIYTRAEYDALDSYDPHTLYFVVEEDETSQ